MRILFVLIFGCLLQPVPLAVAAENPRPKRVLLLGQKPDGHPFRTHEYMAGVNLMAEMLQPFENLQTIVVSADDAWSEGPDLIDGADVVVVFLSQGAKWLSADAKRLAAFKHLAQRGGGFVCLHWGMGTRDAEDVPAYVSLFGGCHGGPDRKYKVVETSARPATIDHPILRGIKPFNVHEEFYYRLKFPAERENHVGLIFADIEDREEPVAWAWEREDGGRSFGFSGGHFHKNWKLPEYRRLMVQGILWTGHQPIRQTGIAVDVKPAQLQLEPR
ncbi:ThuA domain-containing protein [Thalassoroseus pseudoceratinae]|uniref:ThuA domain-containing protein n=1 Tax=Thalassoroseus pseudoceratinae TaxID=2713176 RepID=UPI0014222084|nr:ThuA domain-containing protein [Thalassoroseus pseudoceratinae]